MGQRIYSPFTTKSLYISSVRPILEYCSVVWCPNYVTYKDIVESVQKQFLLFALRGLQWNSRFDLPRYEHRLNLIHLPTLEKRRKIANVVFVFKLLNNSIDSTYLTSLLTLTSQRGGCGTTLF